MTEMNKIPAHGSNVERAQIPASCKWHVQDIYADEAAWQAACAEYKATGGLARAGRAGEILG